MMFLLTSPQAAMESSATSCISRTVCTRLNLMTPCSWNACLVVSLSVPLA